MLYYKVSVDYNVNRSLDHFRTTVNTILNDVRTWSCIFVENNENYDFEIILTTPKKIQQICPHISERRGRSRKLTNLSCADRNTDKIYINYNRWIRGSKASKLNIRDYRIYLINHEVGHILGLDHAEPIKGRLTPVMNQSTLGIGEGLPNMWPLEWEKSLVLKK